MKDDDLAIPEAFKLTAEQRKAGWDRARADRRAKMEEAGKKTILQRLSEYNEIVRQIVETGGAARERRYFENHAEADLHIAKVQSVLKARTDGLVAAERMKEDVPEARPTEETADPGSEDDMAKKANKKKTAARKPAVKAARTPRQVGKPAKDPSEFAQVGPNTARAKVLKLMDGTKTAEQIGIRAGGIEAKVVMVHASCLYRDCGIGYEVVDGKLSALYPKGKSFEKALKKAAE